MDIKLFENGTYGLNSLVFSCRVRIMEIHSGIGRWLHPTGLKQTGMTVVNAVFIMTAIFTFIFTNFTYSRIARIPEYNRKSTQYLLQWLSRSQFHNTRLDASTSRMVELRQIIKSNLFVQTMTNNQLGFTCGHLFYITKYKYNELILMNIPLILMFYKQISNLD
ncbi:hypothetical protein DERF_011940 [Dermatophagoides farinae]|uniref:Uncharacterized protein n=1 Tax=Dermatophagoides farinae TaxID=6954 RepID=A0A922HT34_DERFA|nr:hypothetical protein DERF_011940 [Dermatophagoides farinae]